MEELLLILFFLVLVLVFAGAALAYLRLLRNETRKERDARLAALAELREGMRQLEEKLSQLQARTPAAGGSVAASPAPAAPPTIETELQKLGFSKIRVLPDPSKPLTGTCEVPVEAMKDQLAFKGRVVLRDGVVVECRLQPSYEVFP